MTYKRVDESDSNCAGQGYRALTCCGGLTSYQVALWLPIAFVSSIWHLWASGSFVHTHCTIASAIDNKEFWVNLANITYGIDAGQLRVTDNMFIGEWSGAMNPVPGSSEHCYQSQDNSTVCYPEFFCDYRPEKIKKSCVDSDASGCDFHMPMVVWDVNAALGPWLGILAFLILVGCALICLALNPKLVWRGKTQEESLFHDQVTRVEEAQLKRSCYISNLVGVAGGFLTSAILFFSLDSYGEESDWLPLFSGLVLVFLAILTMCFVICRLRWLRHDDAESKEELLKSEKEQGILPA